MGTRYWAVLHHADGDREAAILFPGLPGCVSQARGLAEAERMASEALELWAEGQESIPDPLDMKGVMKWVAREKLPPGKVAYLQVELRRTARLVRVNITVPEDELARIDAAAQQQGLTRSALMVKAALSGQGRGAVRGMRRRPASA